MADFPVKFRSRPDDSLSHGYYERDGEIPFVPQLGHRIDVGEGVYRAVTDVYWSASRNDLVVWLEISPEAPPLNLGACGWALVGGANG
ncbi:MAG: hypothetical protein JSR63_07835 [Proteobacteria bacterium]|nr:hypothetical protein [Pseudomonadota bacterium]